MNNELITIVVPVYNTEKYLGECLDSLLCQTYQNIRIICIDDGSKDNSIKLLDEYVKKDKRIYYYSFNNAGAATARNKGIDMFLNNKDSDYITFVDSDDTVEKDFIETLYNAQTKYNVDISTCNLYRGKGDRGSKQDKEFSKKEAIYNYFKDKVFYESPCCKLMKRSIVEKVRFDDGKRFEDTFICYKLLNVIDRIAYIDYASYNVRTREGSSTRQAYSNYNYDKVDAAREILNNYKNTEFENLAYNKFLGILFIFIMKTNKNRNSVSKNKDALDELKTIIKQNGYRNAGLRFYPFIFLTQLGLINKICI